jgi:hypothetical protein
MFCQHFFQTAAINSLMYSFSHHLCQKDERVKPGTLPPEGCSFSHLQMKMSLFSLLIPFLRYTASLSLSLSLCCGYIRTWQANLIHWTRKMSQGRHVRQKSSDFDVPIWTFRPVKIYGARAMGWINQASNRDMWRSLLHTVWTSVTYVDFLNYLGQYKL